VTTKNFLCIKAWRCFCCTDQLWSCASSNCTLRSCFPFQTTGEKPRDWIEHNPSTAAENDKRRWLTERLYQESAAPAEV